MTYNATEHGPEPECTHIGHHATDAYDGRKYCRNCGEREGWLPEGWLPEPQQQVPDFTVGGGGSVYTLTANTDAGREWLAEHVDVPDYAWLGAATVAIEHRCIEAIIEGAQADGLTVD